MSRRAIKAIIESSRLLQVVRQAWGVARNGSKTAPVHGDEFAASPAQRQLYGSPTDPAWQAAWAVTERLLKTMHAEVKQHGARFAVVTLTNGAQVDPDPKKVEALCQKLDVPDLDEPDRRISAIGKRDGFEVLNLAAEFRRQGRENHRFFHGFEPHLGQGHWNEQGHKLAGQLIAKWLCKRADAME